MVLIIFDCHSSPFKNKRKLVTKELEQVRKKGAHPHMLTHHDVTYLEVHRVLVIKKSNFLRTDHSFFMKSKNYQPVSQKVHFGKLLFCSGCKWYIQMYSRKTKAKCFYFFKEISLMIKITYLRFF